VSLQIDYCYRGNHAVYINYEFSTIDLVDKKTGETLHLATKGFVVTYSGEAPKTYPLECSRVYHCGADKPLPRPM
jgi:hypothetical protein